MCEIVQYCTNGQEREEAMWSHHVITHTLLRAREVGVQNETHRGMVQESQSGWKLSCQHTCLKTYGKTEKRREKTPCGNTQVLKLEI